MSARKHDLFSVLSRKEMLSSSRRRVCFTWQLLQNNRPLAVPINFYAFDLLNSDGKSLLNLPIERRRELLGSVLAAPEDPMRDPKG